MRRGWAAAVAARASAICRKSRQVHAHRILLYLRTVARQ